MSKRFEPLAFLSVTDFGEDNRRPSQAQALGLAAALRRILPK